MKVILEMLNNKVFLWALIALMIVSAFGIYNHQNNVFNKKIETYERQLRGELTDKEKILQSLNTELGTSKSELVTRNELIKRLEKDKEELSSSFEKFKKEHNLQIISRDKTIASLEQRLRGGNTSTEVVPVIDGTNCTDIETRCVISYSWSDALGRFKLLDPNIFEKNNEIFESSQLFKIYGEVYEQKDGSLQTRRLVLREVYKDEFGKYVPIPNAKADIIDSQFEYYNPPTEENNGLLGLFSIRPIVVGSAHIVPQSGQFNFGAGIEFFNWNGIGVNTYSALDFNRINLWEHRIGISHRPSMFNKNFNLSLGASVGSPYVKFGNEWSLNIDMLFYLYD